MDPYLKHTVLAMLAGVLITHYVELDFWPQVVLGVILAIFAKVLSSREESDVK